MFPCEPHFESASACDQKIVGDSNTVLPYRLCPAVLLIKKEKWIPTSVALENMGGHFNTSFSG